MPGLLDFLTNDDGALGVGLLAAGGPVSDPNASGFGARLANAVNYAQGSKAAGMRNKLLQSQIDENATQDALRKAQLERQARMDNYFLGGGFGAPTAAAAPAAAGSTPVGGAGGNVPEGAVLKQAVGAPADAPRPPQGKFAEWSKQFNIPVDALVSDYVSNGGKGIAEMLFKASQPDMKESSGGYIYNAKTVQPGFLPAIKQSANGVTTAILPDASDPSGVRVVAPGGALPTAGAYAEQDARTKAAFTPGRPKILPGGRMGGQSQLDEINGGPAAPPAPAGGRALIGPGYAGGSANAAAGGQADIYATELRSAQAELAAAQQRGDAAGAARAQADIAGLQREIARLPGGGGAAPTPAPLIGPGAGRGATNPAPVVPGGGLEFSPQEKADQAAAQKLAEGRAGQQLTREQTAATTGRQFSQMSAAADMASKLLDEGPTGSGVGALADKVGSFVGQPLKGASQAAQLKALGGWLVANVPRMEGPQSDRDVANYNIMAGQVGDETLPVSVRKAALRTVIELQSKYAAINGGAAPAGTSASAPNTTAAGFVLPQGWSVRVK